MPLVTVADMFDRFVFVKLKEQWANQEGVADFIAESRRVFPSIPGVLRCRAGQPADAHAGKGWDVCIVLGFASLEEIEVYRVHPAHQAFLDEFLGPRAEAKRVWNFETEEFLAPEVST
ncbi:MAG: Dabb family protein [Myxococcales bacterium]|nr:Dabb family protein [Myxococcales bacterium]